MTFAQLVVTVFCGIGGLGLTFAGVYWMGMREAYRQVSRDLMDIELANILAQADEGDEGAEVLA